MSQTQIDRIAWRLPYTIIDQATIESLPDDLRAVVERFSRAAGHDAERSDADEDAYKEGFQAGVEEAADNAAATYYSPRRRRRSA